MTHKSELLIQPQDMPTIEDVDITNCPDLKTSKYSLKQRKAYESLKAHHYG